MDSATREEPAELLELGGGAPWRRLAGPACSPLRAPASLGAAGQRWWRAAWAGPSSAEWSAADLEQVRRAAALADRIAGEDAPPVGVLAELRRLEDDLALTRHGRLKLRLLAPGEEPPPELDYAGRPLSPVEARRMRRRRR